MNLAYYKRYKVWVIETFYAEEESRDRFSSATDNLRNIEKAAFSFFVLKLKMIKEWRLSFHDEFDCTV